MNEEKRIDSATLASAATIENIQAYVALFLKQFEWQGRQIEELKQRVAELEGAKKGGE